MTFTSTTVTATAVSTAAASSPSIATTAAGAVFSSAPWTSSGNSFSSNSSRRRSNSKSGSISTVCMLWWALTKGYGSGTLRKHSRSIVRITAERSIPDFWLAPIYIYIEYVIIGINQNLSCSSDSLQESFIFAVQRCPLLKKLQMLTSWQSKHLHFKTSNSLGWPSGRKRSHEKVW